MMKTIHAVFENGVFRPKEPVAITPGSEVELFLNETTEDPVAILTARFPNSFGVMSDEDANEMQRIIDEEFGQVNPDEWR